MSCDKKGKLIYRTNYDWPQGKSFAFSIFDDTDCATLNNIRPVYELLDRLGVHTTKSVWPLAPRDAADPAKHAGGATCAIDAYLDWLQTLQRQGFEIGYHNATYHSSKREDTLLAFRRFNEAFGEMPRTMANHQTNTENIYWGAKRLSGIRRAAYILLRYPYERLFNGRWPKSYKGEREDSSYFWGDLCKQHIKYVRNFVYRGVNTLKACPYMPYHDPQRPYVNFWFASSDGRDVQHFNELLTARSQEKLEAEGGACIVYTHFGKGFCEDGTLNRQFVEQMKSLSARNGWFVPVSTLLDFMLDRKNVMEISDSQRARIEMRWIYDKLSKML
jgi:hypothetical protein